MSLEGERPAHQKSAKGGPLAVADVAIDRAIAVIGLCPQPQPNALFASVESWVTGLRWVLREVVDAVPARRASGALLTLIRLMPPYAVSIQEVRGGVHGYRAALVEVLGLIRERVHAGPTSDAGVALGLVLGAFHHASTARLAELLGVRPEQVRRWRRGAASRVDTARVLAIAEVVEELSFGRFEPEFMRLGWFFRANADLKGERPVDMLNRNAGSARGALVEAARGHRR